MKTNKLSILQLQELKLYPYWLQQQLKLDNKVGLETDYYKIIKNTSSYLVYKFLINQPCLLPSTPIEWAINLPPSYILNINTFYCN